MTILSAIIYRLASDSLCNQRTVDTVIWLFYQIYNCVSFYCHCCSLFTVGLRCPLRIELFKQKRWSSFAEHCKIIKLRRNSFELFVVFDVDRGFPIMPLISTSLPVVPYQIISVIYGWMNECPNLGSWIIFHSHGSRLVIGKHRIVLPQS